MNFNFSFRFGLPMKSRPMCFICTTLLATALACSSNKIAPVDKKKPVVYDNPALEKMSLLPDMNTLYSKAARLVRNSVMQCFDIAADGSIYYIQIAGSDAHHLNVVHGEPGKSAMYEYMVLEYFGHGTNMAIEEALDGTYIWVGSHGNKGSDGQYGGSQTISRVKYEPGKTVRFAAGTTFHLNGARNIHPAVNTRDGLLCVEYYKKSKEGRVRRIFVVYKLEEAMALPDTEAELDEIKYGGGYAQDVEQYVKMTVKVKELSQLRPVYSFSILDGGIGSVGEYDFQGFDFDKDYLYYYEGEGNGNRATELSKAYVSVIDRSGRTKARKRVNFVSDKDYLKKAEIADRGYMEAEGIKVKDGVFYLGFASRRMVGAEDSRLANIFRYAE